MRLYTLTSDLHGELTRNAHNEQFIKDIEAAIGESFDYREGDFSDFGATGDVIYVRTGGTEALFRKVFEGHEGARVRLLTSGQSNSLAASMEILSWLNQQGWDGEIIHGSVQEIASELLRYYPAGQAVASPLVKRFEDRRPLAGKRYGVVGNPSDWLISSAVDYAKARKVLGAELVDIPISELIKAKVTEAVPAGLKALNIPKFGKSLTDSDFSGALRIYWALKGIVAKYRLDGLTLRCFDLLTAVRNTGCLALAMLNAEGVIAACEGDIPAMLSMAVMRARYGKTGFQANLSRIQDGNFLFAHCTVPLDMVSDYCYDTHFESGIGVAIHGILPVGPARLFKISADLEHCIDERINIIDNTYGANLCRTQIVVRGWADREKLLGKDALRNYFLREPLGNHHIIVTG